MELRKLEKVRIGDLLLFKIQYEELNTEYCVGFIQAMNNKYFTISSYWERITFLKFPQFESLVHYNNIKEFKILKRPNNLFKEKTIKGT